MQTLVSQMPVPGTGAIQRSFCGVFEVQDQFVAKSILHVRAMMKVVLKHAQVPSFKLYKSSVQKCLLRALHKQTSSTCCGLLQGDHDHGKSSVFMVWSYKPTFLWHKTSKKRRRKRSRGRIIVLPDQRKQNSFNQRAQC